MKRLNCIWLNCVALYCVSTTVFAVTPPPLDRPTPPPCCADGICYPKPSTFGWYERRWRRWPTEALAPTPAGVVPPPGVAPDVPPFDLPPVEEEDRRAPPPTAPPEPEEEEDETAPGAEVPREAPMAPPGRGTVPTMPLLPFEDDAPGTEPPTMPPTTPPTTPLPFDEPATEPPPGLPFGPMGDSDPPPAPRFGRLGQSRTVRQAPAIRTDERGPAVRPAAAPRGPANDPPPSLPLSLAAIAS